MDSRLFLFDDFIILLRFSSNLATLESRRPSSFKEDRIQQAIAMENEIQEVNEQEECQEDHQEDSVGVSNLVFRPMNLKGETSHLKDMMKLEPVDPTMGVQIRKVGKELNWNKTKQEIRKARTKHGGIMAYGAGVGMALHVGEHHLTKNNNVSQEVAAVAKAGDDVTALFRAGLLQVNWIF